MSAVPSPRGTRDASNPLLDFEQHFVKPMGQRGDLLGYQYAVLRCVPRVDLEEFVNVGVVLYSQDARYLGVRTRIDEARVHALWPDVDLPGLRALAATLDAVCAGEEVAGLPADAKDLRRFGWITAPRSTVLQPGPVHGGVTRDPAAEIDALLDRLVPHAP